MTILGRFVETASSNPKRVVLPEADDPRIQEAARRLRSEKLAIPIPLVEDGRTMAELADKLAQSRPRMTLAMAKRLLDKPLYRGGAMVAAGLADIMVAGVSVPTRRVIEAGSMTVGLAEGIETPSSFFLMHWRDRDMIFADCAVNADPTADQLADIAVASAQSAAKLLTARPKVALLSFSTHGSARHARIDKVKSALAQARAKAPDVTFDGELQVDAALIRSVAEKKIKGASDVAGAANVLIFPDLDSGNIAYKLVQHFGKAQAIGPILQGFAKPVADLSRGAAVDDIVATFVVTSAIS